MGIFLLTLPLVFVKFWYYELPRDQVRFFLSFNRSFLHFMSFRQLIQTFFKPLKNEYREGLVGFSISIGIFVKTVVIFCTICLLFFFVFFEVLFVLGSLGLPFLAAYLLMQP